jgi:lon-related putative ATP-dependent protease
MKETRDKLRALNHETAMFAVGHLVEALRGRYADDVSVQIYLDEVRDDVVDNVEAIVAPQQATEGRPVPPGARGPAEALARKYRVNLVVDNGALEHAPVVYEDDPTYERLVGRIEHRAEMGTLVTDFHMVQAGALHRANGGYLMLDARKLLSQPMAWQGLKQALRAGQIRIEPIGRVMGAISTVSLEPEPIPLDVKVVLIGERMIYYMLSDADPEFRRLFKVAADFDEQIERSDENNALYARLVATLARAEKLRPLDCAGVARALEYSARQAGDSERLSTRLESLADLLREADYWAAKNGNGRIGGDDVQRAVDAQTRRLDRVRERTQEQITRGTMAIDTGGAVVGQVNGLAVLQVGGFAFGKPSRITARVRIGKGEVVDIEREVTLGGPLHTKGVLILSGYLSAHYAADRPLSLSASLVFEQSYGGIDGDSASSTELYALLSAISGVPIKQGFAVTGSVNQFGTVQAIGGANEKIEGFFDICAERGLTGDQGVLIPATNVKNLMLHRRVVDAARDGKFHIYPVETIEQGIEILTGMPAGQRGAGGEFPEGSLNRLVEARLVELADKRRDFNRDARADEAT